MHRFVVLPAQLQSKEPVFLDSKESHHASRVLRLKVGDVVELIDGQGGSSSGFICQMDESGVQVAMHHVKTATSSPKSITSSFISLAMAVIKPEKMELVIQKACEIGVDEIFLLVTKRCVVKLDPERWKAKHERFKKIILESCKQCGRSRIPVLHEPMLFEKFAPKINNYVPALIPYLGGASSTLYDGLEGSPGGRAMILIGPEGDFTSEEVETARKNGAVGVSLGDLVMRSETAAIYCLSAMKFYYQEIKK